MDETKSVDEMIVEWRDKYRSNGLSEEQIWAMEHIGNYFRDKLEEDIKAQIIPIDEVR